MAKSYPDFAATEAWSDLAALPAYAGIANQRVMIQNKSLQRALVYFGGAAAPAGEGQGTRLLADIAVTGTSDHFWVRGDGALAIQVED
jgi:hypothetical protein